jgi:hypothetical protein
MQKAKKSLRQIQRQYQARKKVSRIEKIAEASMYDQNNFYKLVKAQRSIRDKLTNKITFGGKTWEENSIVEGWATYFEELAAPKTKPTFDDDYKRSTALKVVTLEQIAPLLNKDNIAPRVEEEQVSKAIHSMKNNKAADSQGITAKHFKHVKDLIKTPLTKIMNEIYDTCRVPLSFKSGLVTPILKKGKTKTNPDNYRRITVTPIASKILEKVVVPAITTPMLEMQSKMQRGFSEGSSSSNAALLLTEAIAEAKDMEKPLYVTMLDASKAFDVVDHDALMQALHLHRVQDENWLLMKDWYTDMHSSIKWKGELSRQINEQQGLRQGGGLSASQYKVYTNKNLVALEKANLGFSIGTEYVGCPTCADDTALVHSNSVEMQASINVCEHLQAKNVLNIVLQKQKS